MNAAELYERLDRLPYACDDFIVRFTTQDRTIWVQPNGWLDEENGNLTFVFGDDYDGISDIKLRGINRDGEPMYVDVVKGILAGTRNGSKVKVYIKNSRNINIECDDGEYYGDVVDTRFYINWKRRRVDVWIRI